MENKECFLDIKNARSEEQRERMQRILDAGDDPFSLEKIGEYHSKPILKIGKHWFVTENEWFYTNAKRQFLFISIKYAETISELEPEAFAELTTLATEFCNEYNITGAALCMRFGETLLTGATVKRLHAQLIESDPEQGTVMFPIGRRKIE